MERQRREVEGREDVVVTHRGYPSRQLSIAIRDYGPGNEVVIDGRVYRCYGVTLNWHVPPQDSEVRELQTFRSAWRCRTCGATGTRATWPEHCPACLGENLFHHEYLKPAGFAVDIRYRPHNNLSYQSYLPVETPWITAGDEPWINLPGSAAGSFRHSPRGHVFHYSKGAGGLGYAICLRCGRAASENPSDDPSPPLPDALVEHTRLRGGKEASGRTRCPANDIAWAIKRRQWLGVESWTDVFELQLQLRHARTREPLSRVAAYSLAAALRAELAAHLGVEDREIGCSAVQSRGPDDQPQWSAVLFDTASGGAGLVGAIGEDLRLLLEKARTRLQCPRECDRACQAFLLNYDTKYHDDLLDRHQALRFATRSLVTGLALPQEA